MAAISLKYPLGSAQEHIPMCEKHSMNIDISCEDCCEFICSHCAKTDHKDHDWKTIPTAGRLRRIELKKTLGKVMEEDLKIVEETTQMASKQMEDNQKCCDSEISKLQKHYDAIVSKFNEVKKNFETKLRKNLETKNAKVCEKKLDSEKKREHIKGLVKFLEEWHSTMPDYSLIDNLKDLTNLMSNTDGEIEKGGYSVRYKSGDISEGSLESMIGQTFDLDDIIVIERDSFQIGNNSIYAVEAINEDKCFVSDIELEYIERINIKNKKKEKFSLNVKSLCITENGDVYTNDAVDNSIIRLSPSGSVSTVFSTDPLEPGRICQSTEGGLLITFVDDKTEDYQPDSSSKRLVRHVTLTSDVIREYEYQEDGQTRLFNAPARVIQNGNTDICVVNMRSDNSSELILLSLSGSLKLVYREQEMEYCIVLDVMCDFHCNIIACEAFYSQIHLLSPDREFLKYLLTEDEVTNPMAMSLYKSTIWVGDANGLLKVFQYKS